MAGALGSTATSAAAQTAPTGFCVDTSTGDSRPANEGECAGFEKYYTPAEKAELDRLTDKVGSKNQEINGEFDDLGDPRSIPSQIPANFYGSIAPCEGFPGTGTGANNAITDVYILRTLELAAQIAYDIASNEPFGIAGAIVGVFLGVTKVGTFAMEWIYDVQDECQEIVHRNAVNNHLDATVTSRATQSSVDALSSTLGTHDTEVQVKLAGILEALAAHDVAVTEQIATHDSEMSTQVSDHDTRVTTQVSEHDTRITEQVAAHDTEIRTQVSEHDTRVATQLAEHDAHLQQETDEIDASVAGSRDENVRFYVEDHLDTCRPLSSLLLSEANGGYADQTFDVVITLIDASEAEGISIGRARNFLDTAGGHRAAGDPRKAFQSLCNAYRQLANGR